MAWLLLLVLIALEPQLVAAQEVVMDAARLAHALDRLSVTARVLYVAAHPDDENTRLLAFLANSRHVGATYLSMTRGGGGQNLIGREQESLLDVLRTQELLAARRLDGARQRFTRMRDFGYSKAAAETLAVWGHDEALADVVWAIRSLQPDVVITRFDEQPPNHGHHTASAILAREAFSAAADPARFPEQLTQGVSVWQARRLVYNWPTWREDKPPADLLTIDVGGYDARLGLSYGELAARSRSQHKSQGFGAAGERGPLLEKFVHVAGTPATQDLLDGVPLGWARFGAAGEAFERGLGNARAQLHRDHPETALPGLALAYRALGALPAADPRVRDARSETERLLVAASGLYVRAVAARPACSPGSQVSVKVELVLRRPTTLRLGKLSMPDGTTTALDAVLPLHEKREVTAELRCPETAPISAPYWLADPPLPGRHVLRDPRSADDPEGPSPLIAAVDLELAGAQLRVPAPLVYRWIDRVHGERERRVLVVPPATLTPAREALMFANGKRAQLVLRVRAGTDAVDGRVTLRVPEGYKVEPAEQRVQLAHTGDEQQVEFALTPPANGASGVAVPVLEVGGRSWSFREDVIDYPHVPLQVVLQPAHVKLSPLALTRPRGLVGYVEGSGDTIAADLSHVGVQVELLSDATLLEGDLGRYAAIVLGVRSYNTRDVLPRVHARLSHFVEAGGTLVVQYVTRSTLSPLDAPVGPYPLDIGRGRVTDETAEMRALDPKARILHAPNAITSADFAGWIQERGLYFAERWDAHYQPVFELADPGEPAQRGSLLVARHGRGRYVYTGLSFFRQLPAGVPGAYRLFLNLISRGSEPPP
ncbi:MAG TPA: PIG-L family deacetylase [Polyangiales bacterium]|nr:PIG-L family deacetylase [Polyangiales bacterium]